MRRFRCMTAALVITVMLSTLLFYGRTEVAAVPEQNTEEIYPNILYSLLEPAIYHALSGYYDQPMVFDPRDVVIEGVGQVQGPQELNIVIQRYLGPSSRIATDTMIFDLQYDRVRLVRFDHAEGFDFDHRVQREPDLLGGKPNWASTISKDWYQKAVLRLLAPYIDNAIMQYYNVPYTYDPWDTKILEIAAVRTEPDFCYQMKIEITPYVGPHNSIGMDHLILVIERGGNVSLKKYDQVEDHLSGSDSLTFLDKLTASQ